ncbi:hypothetical protein K474DRAFT_946774 [Panus rudis PR-1116 ss-1]|nr:hypothetical protein K474DRAFT_946774 [Panus rudis PR-1116 ss-1]
MLPTDVAFLIFAMSQAWRFQQPPLLFQPTAPSSDQGRGRAFPQALCRGTCRQRRKRDGARGCVSEGPWTVCTTNRRKTSVRTRRTRRGHTARPSCQASEIRKVSSKAGGSEEASSSSSSRLRRLGPSRIPPSTSSRHVPSGNPVGQQDALHAYNILSSRPVPPPELTIPYEHLHRLARLIAKSNPHTRPLFIHFLSVVSTIHRTGGTVKLWEWNALMDFAGKGFRKTRQRDFVAAFNIFCDMISHKPPGASFIQSDIRPVTHPEPIGKSKSGMERVPDIVTFTTLLDIAARSLHEPTLNRALRIFRQSGLTPNRITYLTLMRYYARRPELSGIRACISQLSNQGIELDTPLVNACIWAFARSNRLDVAGAMYVVMQSHPDDPPERLEEAARAREFLESHEGLRIPSKLKPDDVTYTSLLQCYAYHGDLGGALRVFADMVHWMNDTKRELDIKLVLPAFRAIFCGFVRHGQPPSSEDHIYSRYSGNDKNPWTLDALDALFNDFIHLPGTATPSTRMLFWVLEAFNKLCGGDVEKMREVFHRIERRFRRRWTGRLLEIRRELFPDGNHLDDIEDEPEDQGGEAYNEEGYEDEN